MDQEPSSRPPVVPSQTAQDAVHQAGDVQPIHPSSGDSHALVGRGSQHSSLDQQPLLKAASESQHTIHNSQENVSLPPATRSQDRHGRTSRYQHLTSMIGPPLRPRSVSGGIDWIVPVEEKGTKRRTVGERLQPTIDNAENEMRKYARKALWTGYVLNIAIGLQVFLGALTTGLAAAVTSARQAQITTAILGGLSTMVASYLARARGSGEPELSTRRSKDLEHFLRDCRAFQIDHAHEYATRGDHLDRRVDGLRRRLEEMLGNVTSDEDKKVAPAAEDALSQTRVLRSVP